MRAVFCGSFTGHVTYAHVDFPCVLSLWLNRNKSLQNILSNVFFDACDKKVPIQYPSKDVNKIKRRPRVWWKVYWRDQTGQTVHKTNKNLACFKINQYAIQKQSPWYCASCRSSHHKLHQISAATTVYHFINVLHEKGQCCTKKAEHEKDSR